MRFQIIVLLTLFSSVASAQKRDTLYQLYDAKQFPALKQMNQDKAHPHYYFYKAVYANAVNKPDSSLYWLRLYMGKKKKPPKEMAFAFYKLEHDNYVRSFHFREAAETGAYLLKKFRSEYKEDEIKGNGYANLIWKSLEQQPVQRIEQPVVDTIPFTRDIAGLINLKVRANQIETNFVFDTGAGLSSITESHAEKLGLKILPDSGIYVAGFNNIYNPVRIGIAPELRFGEVIVYNEPFLVFKDEAFTFANGAYKINGIIGFPIAKGLGRISIEAKQLVLEKHQVDDASLSPNFFIETLRPILMLEYKGKLLPFNFDTGANTSSFSKPLFELDSTALLQAGKYIQATNASAGGATTQKVLEVPSLEMKLNGEIIKLINPDIDTENHHVSSEKLYGNIGQDLLRQYKRVVIDFGNSHFRLER
jgi:hypothetical protein